MFKRCLGGVGVNGFSGLVVGFNFGFGGTKTTRNVTWGSIVTLCRKKCSKQLKN